MDSPGRTARRRGSELGEPLVGCSGSLFALLAVAAVLWPGLLGFVVAFAGINLFEVLTGTGGSVAVGVHLGGLACGVVLVALERLRGVELRRPRGTCSRLEA